MDSLSAQRVVELIDKAQHILLLTDERIDGDTMGSTLGLFHVLTAMGKRVDVFSPKPLPKTFEYLPGINVIRRDDSVLIQPSIDLVIVCDCSDGAYLPPVLAKMSHRVPLVCFDHHRTNPRYGTVNLIEPEAASTADLVWRFIKTAKYPTDAAMAQCLLTGVCTDTQIFLTPNTSQSTVQSAIELMTLGGNLHDIVLRNYNNKSTKFLRLWGLALERLFVDDIFGGVATAITQKDVTDISATPDELDNIGQVISEFLNAMLDESHDVVVVYRETKEGDVKGSARSRTKNVAAIAEKMYGGGGHKYAAGFKVKNAKLKQENGKWIISLPEPQPRTMVKV